MGNRVMRDDPQTTGGLREFVLWGGNTIGGQTTKDVFFGSPSNMCKTYQLTPESQEFHNRLFRAEQ
jgi:hypothetical protein